MSGDLSVNFVFNAEGQKLLAEFSKMDLHICDLEKEWIENYIKGEYESNADLKLDWESKVDEKGKPLSFKYEIYKTPVVYNMSGNKHIKTYAQYLINAGIAKSNVGM